MNHKLVGLALALGFAACGDGNQTPPAPTTSETPLPVDTLVGPWLICGTPTPGVASEVQEGGLRVELRVEGTPGDYLLVARLKAPGKFNDGSVPLYGEYDATKHTWNANWYGKRGSGKIKLQFSWDGSGLFGELHPETPDLIETITGSRDDGTVACPKPKAL